MQYIKAERTLKPKASETIKTIITSDKFIARTHTHAHPQHKLLPPRTHPYTAVQQKLFAGQTKETKA